jgi:hypothetical protein
MYVLRTLATVIAEKVAVDIAATVMEAMPAHRLVKDDDKEVAFHQLSQVQERPASSRDSLAPKHQGVFISGDD